MLPIGPALTGGLVHSDVIGADKPVVRTQILEDALGRQTHRNPLPKRLIEARARAAPTDHPGGRNGWF